jgi:hypothetical protein
MSRVYWREVSSIESETSIVTNDKFVFGLIMAFAGYWLLQKPNCNRGCKTIAEHLVTDGLDDVVAGLFA